MSATVSGHVKCRSKKNNRGESTLDYLRRWVGRQFHYFSSIKHRMFTFILCVSPFRVSASFVVAIGIEDGRRGRRAETGHAQAYPTGEVDIFRFRERHACVVRGRPFAQHGTRRRRRGGLTALRQSQPHWWMKFKAVLHRIC